MLGLLPISIPESQHPNSLYIFFCVYFTSSSPSLEYEFNSYDDIILRSDEYLDIMLMMRAMSLGGQLLC